MPNWLITLDRYFPVRYLTLATAALLLAGGLALWLVQPARSWPWASATCARPAMRCCATIR